MEINRLEGIIESILFTMGDSVELSKIALAIGHDEDTTRRIIHCMMDKINGAEERGVKIIELEDSFQMCTKTASQIHADRRTARDTFDYCIQTTGNKA